MTPRLAVCAAVIAATTRVAGADSPDVDLGALGLDPATASFDDHLNIYGFADVGWMAMRWSHPNPVQGDITSFSVGHMNLYVSKNLTPKTRALAEIRFLFAPNGSIGGDGNPIDTTSQDIAELGHPLQWGGIVIERVYVEYDLLPYLTVRAGHWLTPYGIWNIDHGSPTILTTTRPFIINEDFFPEHQTGLDLFGAMRIGDYKLGYHATLSNGRDTVEPQVDTDGRPGFGARLQIDTPFDLKVGLSGYYGRTRGSSVDTDLDLQEFVYGLDAQWDAGGLHLQGEVIGRGRRYLDAADLTETAADGNNPDGREFGGYVLAGYRFAHAWNAMPYAMLESYHPFLDTQYDGATAINIGVNFRPSATFVIKLQATRSHFSDDTLDGALAGERVHMFTSQASWMF